jgi:predicted lactoylglutathione lyase
MKMNYFVFGTNNREKAVAFYDELFDGCGLNKFPGEGRMTLWGNEDFMFPITEPFDENPASNGNGTMLGLHVGSIEEVNRLHHKALDLGGMNEGEPRIRSSMHSGYVRDLDNNKICFYTTNG